ncbi:MAG: hypothetical protein ACTS1X_09410 [Parasphingopyxis sp.]|uniref:hypothetical protein n=1 Tax=Parasphingopyxis sp. TaxID=1920299 RepID=UPI003FA14619
MKIHLLTGLALCGAAMAPQPAMAQETDVASSGEVRARGTNRALDPDLVRCQRRPVPGSLRREVRICLTNRQWDQVFRAGNDDVQDLMRRSRLYAAPGT